MPIGVDDAGIEKLLEQDAGESQVKIRQVAVLVGITPCAIVAVNNLLRVSGAGLDQQLQIPRRLMHVQPQGVV